MEGRIRIRALVRGRVQGVFFRGSTQERARELGVDGWVRNCPDGSVEAVFEGSPQAVAEMLTFCARGPRWAEVDSLEQSAEAPEELHGFAIRSEPEA